MCKSFLDGAEQMRAGATPAQHVAERYKYNIRR